MRGFSRRFLPLQVVVIAPLAVGVFGCGRSKRPSAPPEQWVLDPPASVSAEFAGGAVEDDSGAKSYQHYCAVCHGPHGKGDGQYYSDTLDPRPADLVALTAAGQLSEDHLARVIREGSAAVGKSALCPPWGRVLTDQQIAAIVDHQRSFGLGRE